MSERNASAAGLLWNPGRYWGMTETSCWLSDSFLPLEGKGGKERRKWKRSSSRLDKEQAQPDKQFFMSTISVCSLPSFSFGTTLGWCFNALTWLIIEKVTVKVLIFWLFQYLVLLKPLTQVACSDPNICISFFLLCSFLKWRVQPCVASNYWHELAIILCSDR